ncbi:MAG: hypothetical protein ACE5Q6_21675 [Dehalococcoidia bacterium]
MAWNKYLTIGLVGLVGGVLPAAFLAGVVVGTYELPPYGLLQSLKNSATGAQASGNGEPLVEHLGLQLTDDPGDLRVLQEDSVVYRDGVLTNPRAASRLSDGAYVVINGAERHTFLINHAYHQEPTSAETIRPTSARDVELMRANLASYIWGEPGVPYTSLPTSVEENVADPNFQDLANLNRITRLTVSMDLGFESVVYLFHPAQPNGRAVLYHQGHAQEGFVKGIATIEGLLQEGYTVAGLTMPLRGMNNSPQGVPTQYGPVDMNDHADFIYLVERDAPSPIRFFLTPVITVLNHLDANHQFTQYDMVGLSGGGWTTVLTAALDTRITRSYPVSGSLPIPLRNSLADFEQSLPGLYAIASYTELYVLGASGPGREQQQIFNKFERCCFNGVMPLFYEQEVRGALAGLGAGDFDTVIDTTTLEHEISTFALSSIESSLQD